MDRDGDGVGDLCDPHPDEPRDRIALFDPFTQLHERWTFFGAVPTYTGDAIEFDARDSSFTANLDQPPGESTYQLGGFIRAPGDGQRQVTILALSAGTSPYYFCELNQTLADPVPRVQYTYTYDDSAFTAVETVPFSGPLEQRAFDLTFRQTDAELVCGSTLAPTSASGPLRGDITPVVVTAGGLGIQARYDYFIQIASD